MMYRFSPLPNVVTRSTPEPSTTSTNRTWASPLESRRRSAPNRTLSAFSGHVSHTPAGHRFCLPEERGDVALHLREGAFVDVHHVPRLVLFGAQVAPERLGNSQVAQGVLCSEERSRHVEVARGDEDLHIGVAEYRIPQSPAGVRKPPLVPEVPPSDTAAQNPIVEIALVSKLFADVIVERGGVRRADRRHARIELVLLPRGVAIHSHEAAVEPAHGELLLAKELLTKPPRPHTEIGAIDELFPEPGVAREGGCRFAPLL